MKIEVEQMRSAAAQASELLKTLGSPHRLLILCQLTEGPRSVSDLAAFLGLRDSTVSQHLALLRRDGLVETRREGQTIWYSIVSEPAQRILQTLFEVYCAPDRLCEVRAPRKTAKSPKAVVPTPVRSPLPKGK